MERSAFVCALGCVFLASSAAAQDMDLDGVADFRDNCVTRANPNQLDPDQDGFGSSCDGDFDQDGDTDDDDTAILNTCSFTPLPFCDVNENGIFPEIDDFATYASLVGSPPGPSGLGCAGTVPCPGAGPPAVPSLGADTARALWALGVVLAGAVVWWRRGRGRR